MRHMLTYADTLQVYYRFESVCASLMFLRTFHLVRLCLLHAQVSLLAQHASLSQGAYSAAAADDALQQLLRDARIDFAWFGLKRIVMQV